MDAENMKKGVPSPPPYLTAVGAWALAFGCSVGWGSFVMPGTTFLPIAGPAGTAIGLGVGALVMLIIGMNFHYLMNRYPEAGGTYTYTKNSFGYDHGFLSAWFLVLTYRSKFCLIHLDPVGNITVGSSSKSKRQLAFSDITA